MQPPDRQHEEKQQTVRLINVITTENTRLWRNDSDKCFSIKAILVMNFIIQPQDNCQFTCPRIRSLYVLWRNSPLRTRAATQLSATCLKAEGNGHKVSIL